MLLCKVNEEIVPIIYGGNLCALDKKDEHGTQWGRVSVFGDRQTSFALLVFGRHSEMTCDKYGK